MDSLRKICYLFCVLCVLAVAFDAASQKKISMKKPAAAAPAATPRPAAPRQAATAKQQPSSARSNVGVTRNNSAPAASGHRQQPRQQTRQGGTRQQHHNPQQPSHQGQTRQQQPQQKVIAGSTPAPADEMFTVNGVSFKMIGVQGGTFTMGATSEQGSDANDDEKQAHKVTLSSFSIGQTEVTQELWEAVMGSNPSYYKGAKRPVEQVSWNDCQEFIKKLNALTGKNFRLPTEAEWEYAARGGVKSRGYKYSGSNDIGSVAWYYDNSGNKTHDVGTKSPNELGLYDMSGNVWEWCQDWYGDYSGGSQSNPRGPSSGSHRVRRGGCWGDGAGRCRVAPRDDYNPDGRDFNLGFRLAL